MGKIGCGRRAGPRASARTCRTARYPDWQAFLLEVLEASAASLREGHPEVPLDRLSWGEVSRSRITHPFSARLPWLADLLDRQREPLPGCPQCVRVVYERRILHGASERMVISPGHEADAILHLPAGQSYPLSPHYRDQFRDRLEGRALPLAGKPVEGGPDLKTGDRGLGCFLAQLHPYQYTSSNEARQVP